LILLAFWNRYYQGNLLISWKNWWSRYFIASHANLHLISAIVHILSIICTCWALHPICLVWIICQPSCKSSVPRSMQCPDTLNTSGPGSTKLSGVNPTSSWHQSGDNLDCHLIALWNLVQLFHKQRWPVYLTCNILPRQFMPFY